MSVREEEGAAAAGVVEEGEVGDVSLVSFSCWLIRVVVGTRGGGASCCANVGEWVLIVRRVWE